MKRIVVSTVTAAILALACRANAYDRPWFDLRTTAPSRAFELTVGTGYTQPFGLLESGVGMPAVATPGQGIEMGLGYRANARWSVAVIGQFAELTAERSATARSLTPGIAATYHLQPAMKLDPWVELASGYRLLWENDVRRTHGILTHGLEVARLRLGLDYHEGAMAVGPLVGAGANLFLWQDTDASRTIASPRVSVFVFAGVQGRWDVY